MVRKEFQNFDETLKIASNLLLPVSQRFSELDLVFEVKVQARCDECDRVILFEMGEFPRLWNRFLW